MLIDSDVLDELLEVSIRAFIDVGKQTVFPLFIVLIFPISLNLMYYLVFENIGVTKQINNLIRFNGHFTWVSVIHCRFLESVSVLQSEVLVLTNLGQLLLDLIRASSVNESIGSRFHVVHGAALVPQQMQETGCFTGVESGQGWHDFLEFLLISQMLFILSVSEEVGSFDQ